MFRPRSLRDAAWFAAVLTARYSVWVKGTVGVMVVVVVGMMGGVFLCVCMWWWMVGLVIFQMR